MELFIVENNIVRPTREAIQCFPEIWERDTSEGKGQAIREFTYLDFMCSKKKSNPFKGYSDDEKPKKIIEVVFKGDPYEPDEVMEKAIELYMEFLYDASPSLRFYQAAKKGAEKLQDFFLTFDMSERNNRDMPIYKPGEVTRALKDTGEVLRTLQVLGKRVEEEVFEKLKTKGNKEINHFER